VIDGKAVYADNCAMCHRVSARDPLFQNLDKNPQAAADSLEDLTQLFPMMPSLKLNDAQRAAVVAWINTQRSGMNFAGLAQGGN
jgi:mono/diheme cytochrome c family protein